MSSTSQEIDEVNRVIMSKKLEGKTRALGSNSGGTTNPATTLAANQEVGRVDPSGRADEAATRSPAGTRQKPVVETHRHGPRNPGAQSDRDSEDPAKS